MRTSLATLLTAIIGFPLSLSAQSPAASIPVCSGALDGEQLRMSLEYSDGFTVEAFWNVFENGGIGLPDGSLGYRIALRLNEMAVTDPKTGEQALRPLAEPITLDYTGPMLPALVRRASAVWCTALVEVRAEGPLNGRRTAGARSP